MSPGPSLLVTLGLEPDAFDRLDALRRRYFPIDRNVVPAHISIFHQLPGDEAPAIEAALAGAARATPRFDVRFGEAFRLGGGFAVRVESPGLVDLRARLARDFDPWLAPQDRQPFRPHVTLMNKAEPVDAWLGYRDFRAAWEPFSSPAASILLWRYLGGPWAGAGEFPLG